MFAEKLLNDLGIEIDQEYMFINGNENSIGTSGLRVIYDVIREYTNNINNRTPFTIDLPNPVNLANNDPSWFLYRDEEQNRPFARRYADYVREISGGMKLGSELLGKIGEAANRVKGSSSKVVFDFHNKIDWMPGDFGENENSCWWGAYNTGRIIAVQL